MPLSMLTPFATNSESNLLLMWLSLPNPCAREENKAKSKKVKIKETPEESLFKLIIDPINAY